MSLEKLPTIPYKAIKILEEFDDPDGFCAALAIDGVLNGGLSYAFWQLLCKRGVNGLEMHRIIKGLIDTQLIIEDNIGFCRGDQIEDQDLFAERLVQRITTKPSKLLTVTIGDRGGHAQSLVSYPYGITVEYNALLPGLVAPASSDRVRSFITETLQEVPSYFYALGFLINPLKNESADIVAYRL